MWKISQDVDLGLDLDKQRKAGDVYNIRYSSYWFLMPLLYTSGAGVPKIEWLDVFDNCNDTNLPYLA